MPKIGERKVMVCQSTGKPVEMEYTGDPKDSNDGDTISFNGHSGWFCLHDPDKEDKGIFSKLNR